jgi:hypothetical protein
MRYWTQVNLGHVTGSRKETKTIGRYLILLDPIDRTEISKFSMNLV